MGRYMTEAEHKEIRQLAAAGVPQKEIAKRFGKAPSSICWIIKTPNARTAEQNRSRRIKSIVLTELQEEDLSCLPDNILFQHTKEGVL